MIPYIKNRAKVTNLKFVTVSAINDVLESCSVSVLRDDLENQNLPIEDKGNLPNEGHDTRFFYINNPILSLAQKVV